MAGVLAMAAYGVYGAPTEPSTEQAIVVGGQAVLRESPSFDARPVAQVAAGAPVRNVDRYRAWTRVEAEGRSGWVETWRLAGPDLGSVTGLVSVLPTEGVDRSAR